MSGLISGNAEATLASTYSVASPSSRKAKQFAGSDGHGLRGRCRSRAGLTMERLSGNVTWASPRTPSRTERLCFLVPALSRRRSPALPRKRLS
jgi:hypothetical protein